MASLEQTIQQSVLKTAQTVEQQLDAELERLEKLDSDDLSTLRQHRLKDMKKQAQQQQEWRVLGHGEYTEIPEEKEFFGVTKKSKHVVCHFYKSGSPRCEIVDHHLKILCISHLEARFCKIDVERCPFLTQRLRIKVIPTIVLIEDSKAKDYIVGFTELGNCDDFSTEMMEWRIAKSGCINYNGSLLEPPTEGKRTNKFVLGAVGKKRMIRGRDDDSDDDDF
ncbi:thioredoxin domain-containing protein 9 [Zootermopsis nevadensis]|uniref:Thioredoxin domain-containing protein 9 n=1 Tax=Zootermopsis nevadensis TaxID=136037 RepID=A0A067RQH6_ZOONE|nr:thioredoxin domain-containing protein 9 [Zootermopsis nevadensis]XP_021942680.1 thioredoxin domain-containing protein 9 [Zootermopsis nevadensis]XP_021942681.1 thioredoxin domain-containing protein 9 [Zootermopsis nevadensis]XP_021942682.1 thioredoxin domain-containing protein 9 [Zootermopsis nevadensis]KDR22880.1 Thioredoxin domain-containing protein 9 [Zootermopsis nevadensis]